MIYMDYNATAPVNAEVLEAFLPFYRESFGNPSSIHTAGRRAKSAIEEAREKVARSAFPSDVKTARPMWSICSLFCLASWSGSGKGDRDNHLHRMIFQVVKPAKLFYSLPCFLSHSLWSGL